MKPYLFLYNTLSAVGWAYIFFITFTAYSDGADATELWSRVGKSLMIVQSAAFLEVLHSMFGLVRSPLFTTVMQVSSRLVLVWLYTVAFTECQAHWSLYLMVGSWAAVEVPRYLFYSFNLYQENVFYPLFFLRYSLFMVLYPTGISGEMLQMYTSLAPLGVSCPLCQRLTMSLLVLYLFGGPFMIQSMFGQRRRAYKRRAQTMGSAGQAKPDPEGLLFPKTPAGDRSTTSAGKAIFAASVKDVNPAAAAAVEKERNWRFGYAKHVVANVEAGFDSPDAALRIANTGLDTAMGMFEFVRDGKATSFADAMQNVTGGFETVHIKGTGPKAAGKTLNVPYKKTNLTGEALQAQLARWTDYGTIEPSARDAIAAVSKNPGWMDLSDKYFVLLGAGSAMGPLQVLLDHGANIIAVDIDRKNVWERLIGLARKSSGTMTIPVSKAPASDSDEDLAAVAGCNLLTQAPEIKNWLTTVHPSQSLVIGGYAYLDGALHVKLSMAMCAIMQGVMRQRKDTALGFLCSPTDVFVHPADAVEAISENAAAMPLWQKILRAIGGKGCLRSNRRKAINGLTAVNGLVVPQGPNYALAKRLQHWLAMIARSQGHVVSSNIAPSTATVSVVHNAQFAAAYGGFKFFKPMEVFYQETSNAVMAALLIHDIRNTHAVSHPGTKLTNPLELFSVGSFHGGIWRNPFTIGSIGTASAILFYVTKYRAQTLVGVTGLVGWVAWLIQ